MSKKWQIFVPELVPMHNKGEEAIIRGMADVIFPEGNSEFHFLDRNIGSPYSVDGLHIYPDHWFYSPWRSQEFRLGIKPWEIYAASCSLLRNGLNKFAPGWYKIPQGPIRKVERIMRKLQSENYEPRDEMAVSLKRILECDYLIAGHDGAFNEYDCHVMNLMHRLGMKHGIFGSSMKPSVSAPAMIAHFRQTLADSEFFYCRNRRGYEWAQRHFSDLKPKLAPDPAFGMRPAVPERVDEMIEAEGLGEFFGRPVIMVTTAEPAPIARHSFENIPARPGKLKRHHEVLAALVTHILDNYDVNILFLPHTIGPTPDLDDRLVAKKVIERLSAGPDRVRLLETEYTARDLKALIGRAELLVAERIHSLIGSVGMNTPFMCLGVKQDQRVTMIVGDMCESEDNIHYLNDTDETRAIEHFNKIWNNRGEFRKHLENVSAKLKSQLTEAGVVIRSAIEKASVQDNKR